MRRGAGDVFSLHVAGVEPGARYGFRADGPYEPSRGLWFDPAKLLVDPYALAIDRPYRHDPALAAPRGESRDTAHLVPKGIVVGAEALSEPPVPPLFRPGGLIYELSVRAFTMRHPDVPASERGTLRAVAHPAVIAHLKRLGVDAVELMPVTAWIDERHLPALGLTNAWGYNPVTFMALDPRLAPGGIADLRYAVTTLRAAGIGTILDLVFNHTGESDALGATLSLRGLDNLAYYRHAPDDPGLLVNDTGCGNTLRCDHPIVRAMILDALRHFAAAGVDGFRFDLATVLGRTGTGFDADAALLREIAADPVLSGRILIAEPWDVGPDGYRLGGFPPPFLEWNDRCRDDVRRFWRGDPGALGALATRLAGSSDLFAHGGQVATRSVNFVAAHDGMTLADTVAYRDRHNLANGEDNRDGHADNHSWNNGVEGPSDDPAVAAHRRRDVRALLATLFSSRGTIMLTAGDEFGRTQHGNNNAYAQDNDTTWLNWADRDRDLETFVAALSALRRELPALSDGAFLSGEPPAGGGYADVEWLGEDGHALTGSDWNDPERRRLVMVLAGSGAGRVAVVINGDRRATVFALPATGGRGWRAAAASDTAPRDLGAGHWHLPGRSVAVFEELTEVTQ